MTTQSPWKRAFQAFGQNSGIKGKLVMVAIVLSAVQLASGTVSYFTQEKLAQSYEEIGNVNLRNVALLANMSKAMSDFVIDMYEAARPGVSADDQKKKFPELDKDIAEYAAAAKSYRELPQSDEENKLYAQAESEWGAVVDTYRSVVKAASSGVEADRVKATEAAQSHLKKIADGDLSTISKIMKHEQGEATESMQEARKHKHVSTWVMVSSTLAGAFLSWLIAYFIAIALSRRLSQVAEDLNSGATKVSETSESITTGSRGLSSSANSQASALQQTAASVEQMSAMVQKNADNASKSSERSKSSLESANRGKEIVAELTQAIGEISESNNEIMTQTETSNREIGEIVKLIADIANKTNVINDIVFQTKLLSFNASVEAARAGEHGKGFAVVAEEVGNLAAMSGKAAQEISVMVSDSIQKVEGIVRDSKSRIERMMAVSKEKVERGAQISNRCKEVLEAISADVESVSSMSAEISVACQEQANGVREINQAMSQLDQVTQQNATSARQAADSAEELFRQSDFLKSAVAHLIQTVQGGNGGSATTLSAPKKKATHEPAAPKPASKPQSAPAKLAKVVKMPKPKAKPVQENQHMPEIEPMVANATDGMRTNKVNVRELPAENDPRFKDI